MSSHLTERTPFEPVTLEETGGETISSINNGATSLRYRSYTPTSTVSQVPTPGQRITFQVQSSDYEQLMCNKTYLRLPLRFNATDRHQRMSQLAPLAMLSSAQMRINGQVVASVDNVFEVALFNLRTSPHYKELAETMGGWWYPGRQLFKGGLVDVAGGGAEAGVNGGGQVLESDTAPDFNAQELVVDGTGLLTGATNKNGAAFPRIVADGVVVPAIAKYHGSKYVEAEKASAKLAKMASHNGGADFIVPLGLVFGMCSEHQTFALPKCDVEFTFTVHSDFKQRVNIGLDATQDTTTPNFDGVDTAGADVTFNAGSISLFAGLSIPLDFAGSAGRSFIYEVPQWTVDSIAPSSADHTAQLAVSPSTYKAMVAIQQGDANSSLRAQIADWRAGYIGINRDTGTDFRQNIKALNVVRYNCGPTNAAESLVLHENMTNSKTHSLQEVECRLGSARAPDRPYDLAWASDGSSQSELYRAYYDHTCATHGVMAGAGCESFEDWFDNGAILSFPLIRPHDERSSMLTVRTKFRSVAETTEGEFAGRRVLVYTVARRNIMLDYSSSDNASVKIGDGA